MKSYERPSRAVDARLGAITKAAERAKPLTLIPAPSGSLTRPVPQRKSACGGSERDCEECGERRVKLEHRATAFGPEAGTQIALRFYYRVMDDPRISPAARRLLYDEIQHVFHVFPYSGTLEP